MWHKCGISKVRQKSQRYNPTERRPNGAAVRDLAGILSNGAPEPGRAFFHGVEVRYHDLVSSFSVSFYRSCILLHLFDGVFRRIHAGDPAARGENFFTQGGWFSSLCEPSSISLFQEELGHVSCQHPSPANKTFSIVSHLFLISLEKEGGTEVED